MNGSATDADVVVVGGGLAGLAAARRLVEDGLRPLILEREEEPGGRVRSEEWEGCTIELGATFITPGYRRVRSLLDECGVGNRLRPLANSFRTVVWRDGRGHSLDYRWPEVEALRYRGLRPREKAKLLRVLPAQLRAAASLRFFDMATAAAVDSRTLEDVVGADANRYFTSTIAELFCGWPSEQVPLAFGVLGGRYPTRRMWTLDGGLGAFITELARGLDLRCGRAVEHVRTEDDEVLVGISGGESLRARAAILATRAPEAAEIWPEAAEDVRRFLRAQSYSRGFGVLLRTSAPVRRFDDRGRELLFDIWPGGGDDRALLAATYMNAKAPDGGLLALSASPRASSADSDDAALAARLEAELGELLPELEPTVTARRILRWPTFVPTYPVGRARALAEFRARLGPARVQLAGDYLVGPLMEAAVASGQEAAARTAQYLDSAPTGARSPASTDL